MTMNPVGHDMRVDFCTDTACFSTIMKLGETNGGAVGMVARDMGAAEPCNDRKIRKPGEQT